MLVFAGFLFVGLKTKAGAGQIKAWNMATNQEYLMEGHTVSYFHLFVYIFMYLFWGCGTTVWCRCCQVHEQSGAHEWHPATNQQDLHGG